MVRRFILVKNKITGKCCIEGTVNPACNPPADLAGIYVEVI